MKFLIQKINKEIRHDFAFTLIDMIRFKNWLVKKPENKILFLDYDTESNSEQPIPFKDRHKEYVPIGSVEFVTEFLQHFYGLTPKPRNVPIELFKFAKREIKNGTEKDLKKFTTKQFVKSNDKIKGFFDFIEPSYDLPKGNYQFSQHISIVSEWRGFVYENKLVGLQNYSGDFTTFPNVETIKAMMIAFARNAPAAYTLDVGITQQYKNNRTTIATVPIEIHDFFSCGLYGFNQPILVNMFYRWFKEYIKINNNGNIS